MAQRAKTLTFGQRLQISTALRLVLMTYHETWVHSGTSKVGKLLQPPIWVEEARKALKVLEN